MKRIALTAFATICATTLMAQHTQLTATLENQGRRQSVEVEPTLSLLSEIEGREDVGGPRHAKSNGVYYAKPTGSLYNADVDYYGGIGLWPYLAIPAWHASTFVNLSTYPTECTWCTYDTYDQGTITQDLTPYADEEGNFTLTVPPAYALAGGPFVNYNDIHYSCCYEDNIHWPPYVKAYNDFSWMSPLDNSTHGYMGNNGLSTKYYLGTGEYTGTIEGIDNTTGEQVSRNGTYVSTGVYQLCPAPATPLYVRDILIESVVFTRSQEYEPIKNDAVLTMSLYETATGELLHTLTATTGDFDGSRNNFWDFAGVKYLVGYTKFSERVYDETLGIEVATPFVIDCPITVVVSGFEDTENIDLGFAMDHFCDCDVESEYFIGTTRVGAMPTFLDPTGAMTPQLSVYYNMGLALRYDALWDKVSVADTLMWDNVITGEQTTMSGYNTLCISAEGDVCTNDISDPSFDLGALYVNTNCSWFSDDGSENYSFTDELPEWLTAVNVDTSNYSVENERYYNLVSFTAAPNYDEEERTFTTYVQGRGYADTTLVTIRQEGGAEVPEGISSVSADVESNGAVYNIAGQRVSQTAKGVLIKDGKKVLIN